MASALKRVTRIVLAQIKSGIPRACMNALIHRPLDQLRLLTNLFATRISTTMAAKSLYQRNIMDSGEKLPGT